MKEKIRYLICAVALIAMIIISGCVAPPNESSSSSSPTYTYNPEATTAATNLTSSYVTEAPLYVDTRNVPVNQTPTMGYHTFASPTPRPEDKSCLIYTTTQTFTYNGSAFVFNLKNPPMYINYSVIPTNITVNKAGTSQYLTKEDVVYTYSTYDPQSYFEITVRNKTSGKIYLQDGFGTQYTTYLNNTLKVLNADDMRIEIKGNKMTATASFWVKPAGNFDDPNNMTFAACTYWEGTPRSNTAIAFVTGTPTTTWSGGSVVSE